MAQWLHLRVAYARSVITGAVQLPLDLAELSFTASGDSLIRRSVLPSGVRILSERVPGARSATIGYWVAVGSRDEVPETFGSTHFLEHLLFKGTASRSALDIAVSFDAVGGEHNAMTAKEYTCYYAKVQDKDLPMAVEVIADMLTSSLLDSDEFETERGVILEELAMADDDPGDVTSERFFEAVLGDHPLGRPIEQANMLLGVPGLTAADPRRATLSVMNSILGGGMSSRLFQEIREKRGLAYSVYSFAPGYSDAGLFGIYAGCSPSKAGQVAELMLGEFRKLAEGGVTADEIARAQGQLSGASALALEDSDTRMSRLGRSEITLGEFVDLDESLRRISRVSATDIRELAEELASRPLSIAAVGTVEENAFTGLAESLAG